MAYLNQGGLDYFWEKVKEYANSTITVSPKEVSGSICTFDDGSETPVKSLSINIDPVQAGSGDPSPENVRPISGWDSVNVTVAGKNLIDVSGWSTTSSYNSLQLKVKSGYSYTMQSNIPLTIDGTDQGTIYAFKSGESASLTANGVYNGRPRTITPNADGIIEIRYYPRNFITDWSDWKIQLEIGSTATAYEPYQGTVYPISLPQTVYGGVLDVGKGELVVTKKMVDLGTLPWTYLSSSNIFICALAGSKPEIDLPILTTIYKQIPTRSHADMGNADDNTIAYYISTGDTSGRIKLKNTAYTTVDAFTSAMSGIPLVYPLATPVTLSITPTEVRTILGYNNIYADSGEVSVVYCPQAAQKPTIEDVKTSTISVPTGTETDLLDEAVAVKAGHSYAISYAAQFAANSTGYRRTKVYVDGTDAGVIAADIQPAVSGAETVCRGEHWFAASSNGEVMIKGLQNSGGALFASTSVRIIDLGN